MTSPEIQPPDAANRTLVANVHPPDWTQPTPSGRYNLVVVGAGSAGLISAAIAAGLGAKVALIERHLLGGDCLNVGCVPSKAVIRASRMVAEARRAAAELGLPQPDSSEIDFGAAMERMRRIRARISAVDSAARYRDELGVDVYLGNAHFDGRDSLRVGEQRLRFRKAVIATGARPVAPPIEGLAEAGYRSNETIFELTERPQRLAVIGSGPIGCELAQAFARLGCEVTIFDVAAQVLPREDPDAARIIQQRLADEGVRLFLGCGLENIRRVDGVRRISGTGADGQSLTVDVDELLVATGRAPNVEELGLDRAGVEADTRRGVHVNDHLQTSNRNIFAAGDVCMDWKFTHAADAAAKIVVQNALFLRTARLSSLVMPWCTYTDPEVAHVGLYEHEALERGIETDSYTVPLSENDRAITDGEEAGFVKILVKQGGDEILGATLVASHAGEIVSELTLAMVNKVGLGKLMNVIHPYPTQAEAIKRAAGAYTRSRMTPTLHRLLAGWMAVRR
jgi:pyruvate/2-oxoglutarate dehydrogenase complex dihydrolipoamide dehydrogenase (E3) component